MIKFLRLNYRFTADRPNRGHRDVAGQATVAVEFLPATASSNRGELVFRGALPVDDVAQSPRVLVQIELQLAVLVDRELAAGYERPALLLLSWSLVPTGRQLG